MLRSNFLGQIPRRRNAGLLVILLLNLFLSSVAVEAGEGVQSSALPDWPRLIQSHQDRLGKLESDQSALDLFVGTIGPAVGLNDSAATLGAKGIPARLANELLIPDITKSAQRLLASLTAWHLAEQMTRSLTDGAAQAAGPLTVPSSQAEWLTAKGPFPSLTETIQQFTTGVVSKAGAPEAGLHSTALAVAASRLAQEAGQQAMAEWWRLKTWKDRVRVARGQSRLCGTWQWVIHNHQRHHQEEKLSLLFPPPGKEGTGIPGLAEIVVLGDTVYLRWEIEGRTQEDSLLFSKEGQRLEGTFVNSQGGWGSISGKRTASCTLQ